MISIFDNRIRAHAKRVIHNEVKSLLEHKYREFFPELDGIKVVTAAFFVGGGITLRLSLNERYCEPLKSQQNFDSCLKTVHQLQTYLNWLIQAIRRIANYLLCI